MDKVRINYKPNQSGNVLFIILIAVALFAALSYVVTQSSRGGGGDANGEKLELAYSEITQYGAALSNAILRMKISNKCDDTQISFERTPFDGSDTAYYHARAPLDFSCHVFHPNGGGVAEQKPDTDWLDSDSAARAWYGEYIYIGRMCVDDVGTHEHSSVLACIGGVDGRDLTLNLAYLKKDLCSLIVNEIKGTNNIPTDASATMRVGNSGYYFRGYYLASVSVQSIDNAENDFSGQYSLCYGTENLNTTSLVTGEYGYYHVLLAR